MSFKSAFENNVLDGNEKRPVLLAFFVDCCFIAFVRVSLLLETPRKYPRFVEKYSPNLVW